MIIISLGNYRVVLVTREFLLFSQTLYGDVAQLARVLDWQSRGRGFESHLLHVVNQALTLIL
jgi:hypothetical protein